MNELLAQKKYYTGMNDLVFQNAACTEKDKDILKWIIEKSIHYKLDTLNILNNERPVSSYNKKRRTLDVLAITKDEVFNIELNSSNYKALSMRNAGYLMSNYVEDLNRGDNYIKMHKHIQINFTKGLPQDRGIEEIYTLTNVKSGHNYIENFTIIEYNIDKLISYYHRSDKEKVKEALKYKHVLMLGLEGNELAKLCKGEKHMEKFRENVDRLNKDEEFRLLFSEEEDALRTHNTLMAESEEAGIERGIKQGIKQGKIEGEQEKTREIAKNMLAKKVDINFISEVTGLSENEIKALNN